MIINVLVNNDNNFTENSSFKDGNNFFFKFYFYEKD